MVTSLCLELTWDGWRSIISSPARTVSKRKEKLPTAGKSNGDQSRRNRLSGNVVGDGTNLSLYYARQLVNDQRHFVVLLHPYCRPLVFWLRQQPETDLPARNGGCSGECDRLKGA